MTQGLSQYPATCKGEDNLYLLCPLLEASALWVMRLPGEVGKGVGHKGDCPTWEGRKQRNWTGSGLGGQKYSFET